VIYRSTRPADGPADREDHSTPTSQAQVGVLSLPATGHHLELGLKMAWETTRC